MMPTQRERKLAHLAIKLRILDRRTMEGILRYLARHPDAPPLLTFLGRCGKLSRSGMQRLLELWYRRAPEAEPVPGRGGLPMAALKADALLARILIAAGLISRAHWAAYRDLPMRHTMRLGSYLLGQGLVTRVQIDRAIAALRCHYSICARCAELHERRGSPLSCPGCHSAGYADAVESIRPATLRLPGARMGEAGRTHVA